MQRDYLPTQRAATIANDVQISRATTPLPRAAVQTAGLDSLRARWRSLEERWHYPAAGKRDLRLDFLRGSAVLVMVVDHWGGASWLYLITGNNAFFTSGAEAFVVISGLVVGMVYKEIMAREGFRAAALKALRRALTLYALTVVLTLAFAAVSIFFHLPWSHGMDLGDPLLFVLNVIILHETYYLADIPMMYTIFMALAVTGLWLLQRHQGRVVLLLSSAVWLGFQLVNSQQIMIWPIIGNTTFHPAAWQLFFAWAMVIGYHRDEIARRLARLPRWPYFIVATLLFLALIDIYSPDLIFFQVVFPGFREQGLAIELFNKSTVAPGRILATFILFQFMYSMLTLFWQPIRRALAWFFVPLGQNGLYAYTMHVILIGLFYIALPYLPFNVLEHGNLNTLVQLGVVALLWVMVKRRFLFGIIPR